MDSILLCSFYFVFGFDSLCSDSCLNEKESVDALFGVWILFFVVVFGSSRMS